MTTAIVIQAFISCQNILIIKLGIVVIFNFGLKRLKLRLQRCLMLLFIRRLFMLLLIAVTMLHYARASLSVHQEMISAILRSIALFVKNLPSWCMIRSKFHMRGLMCIRGLFVVGVRCNDDYLISCCFFFHHQYYLLSTLNT